MQALQPGLHRQVQKIAGSIAWATQTRPQVSPSDSMHFKKLNLKKERKTARKTARKNNERQRNYKNRVQYSITERTRRYK